MSLKTENSRRVAKSRPVCMGLEQGSATDHSALLHHNARALINRNILHPTCMRAITYIYILHACYYLYIYIYIYLYIYIYSFSFYLKKPQQSVLSVYMIHICG